MEQEASRIIARLGDVRRETDAVLADLRSYLTRFDGTVDEEQGSRFWHARALTDAIIRIQVFLDRNFSYIESLGLLALCRYTLELVVWLRHMEMNEHFALLYARMLMRQQTEYYDKLAKHLQREIRLYEDFGQKEAAAHQQVLGERGAVATASDGRDLAERMNAASAQIDEALAKNFAMFSHEVAWHGYGFLAHRLRTGPLVDAEKNAEMCRASFERFSAKWVSQIGSLGVKEWKWNARADAVRMTSEYEFIYSYTSRLLHATPPSLTTNQKSLEMGEVVIFLRYIDIQFHWLVQHARRTLEKWLAH